MKKRMKKGAAEMRAVDTIACVQIFTRRREKDIPKKDIVSSWAAVGFSA